MNKGLREEITIIEYKEFYDYYVDWICNGFDSSDEAIQNYYNDRGGMNKFANDVCGCMYADYVDYMEELIESEGTYDDSHYYCDKWYDNALNYIKTKYIEE